MKPRLVFLDIDGVLNNRRSMQFPYVEFEGRKFPTSMWPQCVDRMNRLVVEADCDVVLSSSWRYMTDYEHLGRFLRKKCGCKFDLIGSTPKSFPIDKEKKLWSMRGMEIQRWRETHNDERPFVIIDDDSDMEPHTDRLVSTDHERGFVDRDLRKAFQLFGLA